VTDLFTGTDPIASWILALVLLAIVSLVVWLLLRFVARTATEIEVAVAEVWARGQRVANNTIHIAKAHEIATVVERIVGRAGRILANVEAIKAHAESRPASPTWPLPSAGERA
jgi:hypothetical protein